MPMIAPRLLGPLSALAALVATLAPATAETWRLHPKAVVELFTSQGCSSCPPADALLSSLAGEDDVIALAYHVDYWDYVGWPDTFGSPDNSDLQRSYAKGWNSSRIYTPQMVINGTKDVVGSRRGEVQSALQEARLDLPVQITVANQMLKIAVPARSGDKDAVVWLVTYRDRAEVAIAGGENAGKTMVYTQVVTRRQLLGMWEAATGAQLKLPLDEVLDQDSSGVAVLVQQDANGLPGPIVGAAAFER
ncbi:DUF1223 domain-containing protein [uncultured Devosia sp.]|uniref:DUF1223 domain-containing protein n=1 Tax=uncultured Devosia sp. TaxID=211434 RepID=UPI0035CAC196